ncbi:MAG: ABC transporter ATP-binding protein [Oscillospiraceae bacterium]|nr:ABC transporter ATP-binding protein [Oscillospiraceae bacterium]
MIFELNDLSCGYAPAQPVLSHVQLRLTEGEVCCVLGPNGVGKTTIFKTILNLLPPLSGNVAIDGEDTRHWKPRQIARVIAYVAQAHVPAHPYKVKDIAMMGRLGQLRAAAQPGRRDHELVEQALEDVGIRHLRDKPYTEISGGERQLLMIARALAQQSKLLIMDEPTANLDYGNMARVMQCIRSLAASGMAVMFTSHIPDQAFYCGAKTLLLVRGGNPRFGPAEEIITERSLREAYGTDIQILEIIGEGGRPLRVTSPRFAD